MSKLIILDSGPLGMATNPKASSIECQECKLWLENLPVRSYEIVLPEISDYEVRRELLRADKSKGIKRLNQLKAAVTYLPINTEVMLLAAQLWAEVRQAGKPTADSKALDGDVILAAQAKLEEIKGNEIIIATTNVGHLSLFVDTRKW